MVLLRKIKSGRRSIVWRANGHADFIDGPRLVVVWPCINRIQPLALHHANDMEYLETSYLDGTTSIQPGPAALFDDPLKIARVVTKDLIQLDANEMLILYTQLENAEKHGEFFTLRRISIRRSSVASRSLVDASDHPWT